MRKGLSGIITLMVLTLLISACSGGNNTAPTTNQEPAESQQPATSSEPKDGGNLIIGVASDPVILNPVYAGDRVSLTIDQALYAPLFQVNDGVKTFYLADSLTLSEDNLTYTLKLKDGLTWHDGEKLTADDVVFTIDSMLDEKQNSFLRSNLVINDQPIKAVKKDDLTVDFQLPQVNPGFEATLLQVFPIPKHIFENETDMEKSTKNASPVGSGPFKFKEYKTGEYLTVERFDNYFGGKPHLDSVTYRIAKDTNAANLALQSGEINIKYLDPQDVGTIQATNNFEILPYSEGRLSYMLFNANSDTGALAKPEVRQALSLALSRDEIIQTAYTSSEYADPAKSFLTPDTLFHTNDVVSFDNDVDKAKQLLESAGVSNLKLRFIVQSGNKAQEGISLYVQQKMKAIGVDVELQNMDATAFVQKFIDPNSTDYELAITGYIMGYDPDAYRILYASDGSSNYSHYANAEVDKLLSDGAGEGDPAKRGELYKKAQEIIAEDAPIYPISYTKTIVAVSKNYGGIEEAVLKPVVIFEDLSKLYLK
ncbi:ABC transporter substrate-binding protein [Paenibacillus sp. FA6]|uniref:ABC transporter substrate-binding protein n=1 Tax=Paenibacillus sp. FA6 TaxID=3413029 RepID=UPI003F65FF54